MEVCDNSSFHCNAEHYPLMHI